MSDESKTSPLVVEKKVGDGEWTSVSAADAAAEGAALGAILDSYTPGELEERVEAAKKARGYLFRDEDELSVESKTAEVLAAIEDYAGKPHWYDVEAYHCFKDGECVMCVYGDGVTLRITCTAGAVVIIEPKVKHDMKLSDKKFLVTIGMYKVDPETIVPHTPEE